MNKQKLANAAAMAVEHLTKREQHRWPSITPGGFYEPVRPAVREETIRTAEADNTKQKV